MPITFLDEEEDIAPLATPAKRKITFLDEEEDITPLAPPTKRKITFLDDEDGIAPVTPQATQPAVTQPSPYKYDPSRFRPRGVSAPKAEQEIGTLEGIANAARNAFDSSRQALDIVGDVTPEEAKNIAKIEFEKQSRKVAPGYDEYQKAEGFDAVLAFAKNPIEVTSNIVAEGLAGSLPALGAGLAAGGVGAAIGAPTVIGAPIGFTAGQVAGTFAGSLATEYGSKILEEMQEGGVDLTKPESIQGFFENEEAVAKARDKAISRGIPVAAFDAISAGIGGKLGRVIGKQFLTKTGEAAAELGVQAGLGGGGEVAGALVAGEPIEGKAVFGEVIGEAGPGAAEIITGRMADRAARVKAEEEKKIKAAAQLSENLEQNSAPLTAAAVMSTTATTIEQDKLAAQLEEQLDADEIAAQVSEQVTPPITEAIAEAASGVTANKPKVQVTNIDSIINQGGGTVAVQEDGRDVNFKQFGITIDGDTAEVAFVEIDPSEYGKGIGLEAYRSLGNELLSRGITLRSSGAQYGAGRNLWLKLAQKGNARSIGQGRFEFVAQPAAPLTEAVTPTAPVKPSAKPKAKIPPPPPAIITDSTTSEQISSEISTRRSALNAYDFGTEANNKIEAEINKLEAELQSRNEAVTPTITPAVTPAVPTAQPPITDATQEIIQPEGVRQEPQDRVEGQPTEETGVGGGVFDTTRGQEEGQVVPTPTAEEPLAVHPAAPEPIISEIPPTSELVGAEPTQPTIREVPEISPIVGAEPAAIVEQEPVAPAITEQEVDSEIAKTNREIASLESQRKAEVLKDAPRKQVIYGFDDRIKESKERLKALNKQKDAFYYGKIQEQEVGLEDALQAEADKIAPRDATGPLSQAETITLNGLRLDEEMSGKLSRISQIAKDRLEARAAAPTPPAPTVAPAESAVEVAKRTDFTTAATREEAGEIGRNIASQDPNLPPPPPPQFEVLESISNSQSRKAYNPDVLTEEAINEARENGFIIGKKVGKFRFTESGRNQLREWSDQARDRSLALDALRDEIGDIAVSQWDAANAPESAAAIAARTAPAPVTTPPVTEAVTPAPEVAPATVERKSLEFVPQEVLEAFSENQPIMERIRKDALEKRGGSLQTYITTSVRTKGVPKSQIQPITNKILKQFQESATITEIEEAVSSEVENISSIKEKKKSDDAKLESALQRIGETYELDAAIQDYKNKQIELERAQKSMLITPALRREERVSAKNNLEKSKQKLIEVASKTIVSKPTPAVLESPTPSPAAAPTPAAPEAAPTPAGISVGSKVKYGTLIRPYIVEEVIPQTAREIEEGDQFYRIRSEQPDKNGKYDIANVEKKDIKPILGKGKGKGARKMAAATRNEEYMRLAQNPEANREQLQRMVDEAAKAAWPNNRLVDSNGNPIRLYHGTFEGNKFTVFRPSETGLLGGGIYLSADKNYAREAGPRVMEVYANISSDRDGEVGSPAGGDPLSEVVIRKPSNVKSADPVTYDDAGNIIPLEERFQPTSPDIRRQAIDTTPEGILTTPPDQQYTFEEVFDVAYDMFGGEIPEGFTIVNDSKDKDFEFKAAYIPESGEIIVNLAYLNKSDDIRDTITHELGHYIFGDPEFRAAFDQFIASLSPEARADLDAYVETAYNKYTGEIRLEEKMVRAFVDQFINEEQAPAWRSMLDAIKRFLNKLGFKFNISDRDAISVFTAALDRYKAGEAISREGGARKIIDDLTAMDAEYLAAVERGDMETAQRMVDEAAKKAGYEIGPVYHGRRTNWTIPNLKAGKIEGDVEAIYFTDNEKLAEEYSFTRFGPRGTKLIQEQEKAEKTLTEILGVTDFSNYHGRLWDNYLLQLNELDISKEEYKRGLNAIETLEEAEQYSNAQDGSPNIVGAFLSYNNKSEVNANRLPMSMINVVVAEKIAAGADLVVVNDAVDPSFEGGNITPSKIYVVSGNEAQIKSADPVTYDDAGDVIPLSQRFRPTSPDIRRMAAEPAEATPADEARREEFAGMQVGRIVTTPPGIKQKTTDIIRAKFFDSTKVSPESTSQAWAYISQFMDKADNSNNKFAGYVNNVTELELPEADRRGIDESIGAVMLQVELANYAGRLATQGDTKMLSYIIRNGNRMPTGEYAQGVRKAGKDLNAVKERLKDQAAGFAAFNAELKSNVERLASTLFGTNNPNEDQIAIAQQALTDADNIELGDANQVAADIKEVEGRTKTNLIDKVDAKIGQAIDKSGKIKDLEKKATRPRSIESQTESVIESLQRSLGELPPLPQRRESDIRTIVKQDLRQNPDMGRREPWNNMLVGRLIQVGVTAEQAQTIADLTWKQHEQKAINRELKELRKAVEEGSLAVIIDRIKNTPLEKQQSPEWKKDVIMEYLREAGLSTKAAETAAKLYDSVISERLAAAKQKAFEATLAKAAPWKDYASRNSKLAKDALRKVQDAIRTGVLDPDQTTESIIAAQNGWTGFTKEQYQRIVEIDTILNDPKQDDVTKKEALAELNKIITVAKLPAKFKEAIADYYVGQALLGIPTFSVNMASPAGFSIRNILTDIARYAFTDPKRIPIAFESLLDSMRSWYGNVSYSFRTEVYPNDVVEYLQGGDALKEIFNRGKKQWAEGKYAEGFTNMAVGMAHITKKVLSALDQGAISMIENQNLTRYAMEALSAQKKIPKDQIRAFGQSILAIRNQSIAQSVSEGMPRDRAIVLADLAAKSELIYSLSRYDISPDEVLNSAINDALQSVGRNRKITIKGIEESDKDISDTGTLTYLPIRFLEMIAEKSMQSGPAMQVFSKMVYGFALIPARVFSNVAWFSPVGAYRFAVDAFANKMGWKSPYAMSLGTGLQYRQRLTETIAGSIVMLGLVALRSDSTEDDEDKKFKIVITGNGPNAVTDKQYYDSWMKKWKPYSIHIVVNGTIIPINIGRGGEALFFPIMLAGALDDLAIKKKQNLTKKEPEDLVSAVEVLGSSFFALAQRGPYAAFTKPLFDASKQGRVTEELASQAGYFGKTFIPVLGTSLARNITDFINDPVDRSSIEGAIYANTPVVGPWLGTKALNALGQPIRADDWGDKLFKLGVPVVFSFPKNTPENALNELILKQGGGPTIPTRSNAQKRFGDILTDKEFETYVREYGRVMSDKMFKSRTKLANMKPSDYDDELEKYARGYSIDGIKIKGASDSAVLAVKRMRQ